MLTKYFIWVVSIGITLSMNFYEGKCIEVVEGGREHKRKTSSASTIHNPAKLHKANNNKNLFLEQKETDNPHSPIFIVKSFANFNNVNPTFTKDHIDEVVAKIDLPKLIEELQKEENEGDDGNILTHVANLVYLNILVKNFKNNQISLQLSQQEGAQKKFREYLERHLKRMCEYYEYEREIDE